MNGLGTPFRIKSNQKNRKKIEVKLPHLNKKSLARKQIYVQTPFSHSTLKLEPKNLRRKTTRLFDPLSRQIAKKLPPSASHELKQLRSFNFQKLEKI